MENATMNENSNPIEEIEKEIEETKRKTSSDNFEIEITEEPKQEAKQEAKEETEEKPKQLSDEELSQRVQTRINKITEQRREAELEAKKYQEETAQLKARLERLERNNVQQQTTQAQNQFQQQYDLTRQALTKAVEEGDTQAQINFQEQLADMRATIKVNELQRQMQVQQQTASPTVGRAQQASVNPAPEKAMQWWQKNNWFNAKGYERETAAARAIDVQLDLEGHDKQSDDYYNLLNSRLQRMFPELVSSNDQSTRVKSRKTVAPTTGGSPYKGNRVRMTQDQLRMARELGINDEASLKKYASEIQKSQRS
jgi:chromosome segregation ATPase